MADGDAAVLDDGGREHAGHALPLGSGLRRLEDSVVGERDSFAKALFDGTGLPFQPGPDALHGDVGRLLAGFMAAHAIDDEEEPAGVVGVHAVLVVAANV